VFVNKGFCDATSRSLSELIGKTDFDLYPVDLAEQYRQDDMWVIKSGRTREVVEEHVTSKGERLSVHVVKTPIYDAHGAIIGTQGSSGT
jgi:PAS domain S-box-containing protein